MTQETRILVTGAAGFIGSFCSHALLKMGFKVLGIDNLNHYYDINLKEERLTTLFKHQNFSFEQVDLIDSLKVESIIKSFKPNIFLHLAAQAGVRYSLENPKAYIDSNIVAFSNILELLSDYKIEKFIFASSSSVYGNTSNIPFSEMQPTVSPTSLYAATKMSNELLAYSFAYNTNIPTIGLRFFTVYGPKGRPDMAYFKFADLISSHKKITVYNQGKMSRDMTYIDDIVNGTISAISFSDFGSKVDFEIFNLGNNSPIKTWDLIREIEGYFGYKSDYVYVDSSLEVKDTWADLSKSKKMLNYSPTTTFNDGIKSFLDWFTTYKKI
jgi:UDP-glucuronate 4-epimerase